MQNFEVKYEKPVILITSAPINSLNQIREIVEYVKTNNKPLLLLQKKLIKILFLH